MQRLDKERGVMWKDRVCGKAREENKDRRKEEIIGGRRAVFVYRERRRG